MGVVPGGTVYSLNPIDQARLLSMGFHQVIHACVKKRVPLIFLEFPRFITDGKYLYEQLRPVLAGIDSSAAIRAHAQTAQPDKVRIGGELANSANIAKGNLFPNFDALDRVALHRDYQRAARSGYPSCRSGTLKVPHHRCRAETGRGNPFGRADPVVCG